MNLSELKAKYSKILAAAQQENRSLNAIEIAETDTLKAQIADLQKQAEEGVKNAEQERSAAAARIAGQDRSKLPAKEYMRSIAKGEADVGNIEVVNDVVRQFNLTSPLFAAHANVQKRSTGNTFNFTVISLGGAGYAKDEGDPGTEDTTSAATMTPVNFKTYSGQKILVTAEAIDDYAADISQEVMTLGLAKSTLAFGADCVAALKLAFTTNSTFGPTETAATAWALSDVVAAYYEIPVRNRNGVKFIMAPATAQAIVSLLTMNNSPQAAIIGLSKDSIVEEDTVPAGVMFVGNPTYALAIGMKTPVRMFTLETTEGRTIEAQPRFAVALRDGKAIACRKLKTASAGN